MADSLKDDKTIGARSILTAVIKLLPGSRSNPMMHVDAEEGKLDYRYFLVYLKHLIGSTIDEVKFELDILLQTYGKIHTLCSERYGMADIMAYADEHEISVELVATTFAVQRQAFNELHLAARFGRLKAPMVPVPGYESDNVFTEELAVFTYESTKKFYGSPTKRLKEGVQDDSVFSLGMCIYGARETTPDDFGLYGGDDFWGVFVEGEKTVGDYEK
jgi:hypothetical protein